MRILNHLELGSGEHLAAKSFDPGKPPFPLMHVDTTWEFREVYEFRRRVIERYGLRLMACLDLAAAIRT